MMAFTSRLSYFLLLAITTAVTATSTAPTSSPSPITNKTTPSTASACTSPTGFANTAVPVPTSPGPGTYSLPEAWEFAHYTFLLTDLNTLLPEAAIASFCLDQCISYRYDPNAPNSLTNGSPNACVSFTVDLGKPYPPNASDTAQRWYCTGFDVALSTEMYKPLLAPGSYQHGIAVNRVCGGSFRAY